MTSKKLTGDFLLRLTQRWAIPLGFQPRGVHPFHRPSVPWRGTGPSAAAVGSSLARSVAAVRWVTAKSPIPRAVEAARRGGSGPAWYRHLSTTNRLGPFPHLFLRWGEGEDFPSISECWPQLSGRDIKINDLTEPTKNNTSQKQFCIFPHS